MAGDGVVYELGRCSGAGKRDTLIQVLFEELGVVIVAVVVTFLVRSACYVRPSVQHASFC